MNELTNLVTYRALLDEVIFSIEVVYELLRSGPTSIIYPTGRVKIAGTRIVLRTAALLPSGKYYLFAVNILFL